MADLGREERGVAVSAGLDAGPWGLGNVVAVLISVSVAGVQWLRAVPCLLCRAVRPVPMLRSGGPGRG